MHNDTYIANKVQISNFKALLRLLGCWLVRCVGCVGSVGSVVPSRFWANFRQ